jgi:GMP synthase-like glutamine amidotransferase
MRIGILQTGRTPEELRNKHGDYDHMLRRFLGGRGFEFVTYPRIFKSVRDAVGWLISGLKFGVYENHSWIPPLEDFLRHAYAEPVPIVRICFGHKLMG